MAGVKDPRQGIGREVEIEIATVTEIGTAIDIMLTVTGKEKGNVIDPVVEENVKESERGIIVTERPMIGKISTLKHLRL